MSSRYWRHPEYELKIEVTNASALRTPSASHLAQRVGEQRMPIAIAPIDGQARAVARQLFAKPGDQRAVLIVDRALAAEVVIMLGDRQHPFPRHIAPAQHVLEKRNDVVRFFRSSEREHQNGVIRRVQTCILL